MTLDYNLMHKKYVNKVTSIDINVIIKFNIGISSLTIRWRKTN